MSCELKFNCTQKGAERREKAVIFGGRGQVETPEVDGLRAAGNPDAESERRDAACFAGRVKEGARRKREGGALPWREGVRSARGGTDAFGRAHALRGGLPQRKKPIFGGNVRKPEGAPSSRDSAKKLRSGPSGKAQGAGTAGCQGARAACGSSVTAGAKRSPACGKFSGRVIHAAARLKGEKPPDAQRCATSCSGRISVR